MTTQRLSVIRVSRRQLSAQNDGHYPATGRLATKPHVPSIDGLHDQRHRRSKDHHEPLEFDLGHRAGNPGRDLCAADFIKTTYFFEISIRAKARVLTHLLTH